MKEQIANKMNELIKIDVNEEGKQLVSARELHEFLGINSNFTTWFNRMCEYGFMINTDYIEAWSDSKNGSVDAYTVRGLNPKQRSALGISKDYAINLDMAKEISMIQRTEKGKQARQYFIACEKKLKDNNKPKKLSAIDQLKLQNEAILEVNQKVDKLEADMPLFKAECDELQALVKKTGTRLLGGKDAAAYKDKSTRTKVYTDIQHQLKREFGVNKYSWIKHSQFNMAKEIIEGYKLPICLEDDIEEINRQLSFD